MGFSVGMVAVLPWDGGADSDWGSAPLGWGAGAVLPWDGGLAVTGAGPTDVPELRALIGEVAAEQLERSGSDDPRGVSAALRVCFTRLMKSEKKFFVDQLNMLVRRISQEGGSWL